MCKSPHYIYDWPALEKERFLLIGDSIVKFINRGKHLRVMAFPGATSHTIYEKICKREIVVEGFDLICLAIGTNDVSNEALAPSMVTTGIMNLMDTIHVFNPEARLVVLGMLVRPKDEGRAIEYRRKLVNNMVQGDCKRYGIHFTKAWRALMNGSYLKPRVYAQDGLHLNRFGARFLYRTIEGNIRTLAGLMKL
jgi:lysophospholipase L1-like esterase